MMVSCLQASCGHVCGNSVFLLIQMTFGSADSAAHKDVVGKIRLFLASADSGRHLQDLQKQFALHVMQFALLKDGIRVSENKMQEAAR